MKNFEKWAETQKGLIKYDEITSEAAKLAWKAALEWVSHYLILFRDVETEDVVDYIEKELKGE